MAKRRPDTVTGVLILNKHAGVTSHRIVAICRRLYDTQRVGHTGTLDPMATGVLPILLGRAVKASEYVMANDKEYRCEMKLGLSTDTEDITGTVLETSDQIPDEDAVRAACASFVGTILQTPPMYSALKVGGRKLVDIAREGGEVERTPREVEISAIDVERLDRDRYALCVACSKGTYIRTLCADIGKSLGCGAVMAALERTRTGDFTLSESVTVEELEAMTPEERLAAVRPVEDLFPDLPAVTVGDFHARLIWGGADLYQKKLRLNIPGGELVRIRYNGQLIALARSTEREGEAVLRPDKLFVLQPADQPGTPKPPTDPGTLS